MKAEHFTVSELAKVIGEKPRTIQFWAEVGVLRAASDTHRQGKGVHRRFPHTEIPYATLAHKLASMNCPIGEIETVINVVREISFDGIGNALERVAGYLEESLKQEEGGPTRREILNYVVQEFQKCFLMVNYGSDAYVLICYYMLNEEVHHTVRFWSPAMAEVAQQMNIKNNSITDMARIGLTGYIGHKAIYFEKGEELIIKYLGIGEDKLKDMQKGAVEVAGQLLMLARTVAGVS